MPNSVFAKSPEDRIKRSPALPLRIFLYEPNDAVRSLVCRTLEEKYDLTRGCLDIQALAQSGLDRVSLAVFAWANPAESLANLVQVRKHHANLPILLLCCSLTRDIVEAAACLHNISVLEKPFTSEGLKSAVLRCIGVQDGSVTAARESALDSSHTFVRASEAMHEVERQAALVAPSDIPVLILGESGTGKEIIATFLHARSKRKNRTFMKINCAAMPAELLESELFGYEQGAFTGAQRLKPGRFEVCDGGTIFLDEIGEMPAPLQAKLLQVLQDGSFSRLGGRTTLKTDVRIISATNIAMKKAITQGTFREDLYYRLNGISIKLPPLRERKEEIPVLVRHFLKKGAERFGLDEISVSPILQDALLRYNWPGNLRELENLMNRLLVLRDERAVLSEIVDRESSPVSPARAQPVDGNEQSQRRKILNKDVILRTLEENRWNRRASAVALQISYKTLLSKIRDHNLGQGAV